jgi:hypothetical protein
MSRPSRRRLVLAAVTGLLLLPAAAPAQADPQLEGSAWTSPLCATGDITNYVAELDPSGNTIIHLEGWSAVCPPLLVGQQYEFGLIFYGQTQDWVGRLSQYGPGTTPTSFTYHINYTLERRHGTAAAICLAYDEHKRLSCLALDPTHSPMVYPIPVDHALVSGAHPISAYCGNCAIQPRP